MQVIQVCYGLSEENKNREINGLVEALEIFDLPQGVFLTFNQHGIVKIGEKHIKIVPTWCWLENKT